MLCQPLQALRRRKDFLAQSMSQESIATHDLVIDLERRQCLQNGLVVINLFLLAIQFVLGIYTNLFVALPKLGPGLMGFGGSMGPGIMFSRGMNFPLFMTHMMLGVLLALVACVIALLSLTNKEPRFKFMAWVAFLAVLVAGYGGLSFLMGGQNNGNSLMGILL